MIDFLGIHWSGFGRIVLFPFFVVAIIFVWRVLVVRLRAVRELVHPNQMSFLFRGFSFVRERYKAIAMTGALLLFFLAMLLPQWGKRESTVVREGRDLLVVLDISRSMLAQDYKPDRLVFAKLKIRTLLQALKAERVGLVLFSGVAFLQCPLTADYNAFLNFLEHVDVETIATGTTSLDRALLKSIEVFAQTGSKKNKLVLLITDGEDFSSSLQMVREKAAQEQIKLFALGVGTPEGAPIPKMDARGNQIGTELDEQGGIALTKLNEPLLQELTEKLGGFYLRASQDDGDIAKIAQTVERFEKEQFDEHKVSLYEHQYHWFLLGAWVLLVLEWIL